MLNVNIMTHVAYSHTRVYKLIIIILIYIKFDSIYKLFWFSFILKKHANFILMEGVSSFREVRLFRRTLFLHYCK